METEIKLSIHGAEQAMAIQKNTWFASLLLSEPQTVAMRTRYYDTAARDLQRKVAMLRVRDENGDQVLTCKKGSERSASGLYQRQECEMRIDQVDGERNNDDELIASFLDFVANNLLDETQDWVSDVFLSLTDKAFECVAEVAFERTIYEVTYRASNLEIAFDLGHFVVNGKNVGTISELEAELMAGTVDDLLAFGDVMQQTFALHPENRSKYERALIFANAR